MGKTIKIDLENWHTFSFTQSHYVWDESVFAYPAQGVKHDNMWTTTKRNDRLWYDYYLTRFNLAYTVRQEFRDQRNLRGHIGFQTYAVRRNAQGQLAYDVRGKPLNTLQQAKDFVAVLVRLEQT
jgi:hypothetical protein